MTATTSHRVGVCAGMAVVVSAAGVMFGLAASPAYAAEKPALRASISKPGAVAPGSSGKVRYEVTNVSDEATQGILLNVSLPPYVSLDPDKRHCQRTGTNDAGGRLISCNFSDQLGKLAPGETRVANTPFHIAKRAPGPTKLGKLGALVVPLKNGKPTEDWTDLDGHNVVRTPITTSANTYDLSVSAEKASGKVGDKVTIAASATNAGPSDVRGGDVHIVAPTGTRIVKLPEGCRITEEGRKARCSDDGTVKPGQVNTADLIFKIIDGTVGDDGSVSVSTDTPGADADSGNDTAPVTIKVTGGGKGREAMSGSQGGGQRGEAGDEGDDGGLPVTGSPTSVIAAGIGVAVLLLGVTLLLLARRRRRSQLTDPA